MQDNWQLATDVFASIRERAKVACDTPLMIEATLQLGKSLRVLGNLAEADDVYLDAIREAERIRDIDSSLLGQLGRVQIVVTSGDLPRAEKTLEALAIKAMSCNSMEMYGRILHGRADLAFLQGNYNLTIRAGYQRTRTYSLVLLLPRPYPWKYCDCLCPARTSLYVS